jgi:hypothetical protein
MLWCVLGRTSWLGVGLVVLALVPGAGLAPAPGAEPEHAPLFPLVLPWDDRSPGIANVAAWQDRPAGKNGPVMVQDGHLHDGRKRLRLLGVNLCFGANFPRHDDAAKIAGRLAKFGINAVRFHHMDAQRSPGGIFAADGRTLDPDQLDRLDYLIAQLKDQGIYADLNLHVSRTYPDLPSGEGMPSYHKGVDQFVPRMIEWQRDYARALLNHVNPYTHSRYGDEPAVALIEINNENALTHEWWGGGLDGMPALYADALTSQWNSWLEAKYRDFEALKTAWGAREVALGRELLVNPRFTQGLEGWAVERHGAAQAEARGTSEGPGGEPAVRVDVARVDGAGWHVQMNQSRLSLRKDEPYTFQFQARADAPRRISVNAMQAHEPWKQFWSAEVRLTTDWQTFRFTFQPSVVDDNARITFSQLGEQTGSVWFADASLRPGGVSGLAPGDRDGHVAIVRKRDYGSRVPAVQRDWIAFLWETEQRYWSGMARFLKEELKVRGLVIGTQMGWSPAPIQAELDVIDSHAYWQHPRFPGRSWDPVNWTVANVPMTGAPDGGTLPRLALARVAGKPFVCTEYNHSAPNTYSSEAFPLLAAFAALQDWDGIFAFAYSHRRDEWDVGRIPSFFDIDQHPAKMATLPAAAALFLRGDVRPFSGAAVAALPLDRAIDRVCQAGPYLGADAFGVDRGAALAQQVGLDLNGPGRATPSSRTPDWTWGLPDGRKSVLIDTPRSKAVIGDFTGESFTLGEVRIAPGPTRQNWAVLTLTAMDGAGFEVPGRLLITATGLAENTAMGWKNPEHTTLGRDWGRAPTLVEGVSALITLPAPPGRTRVWALDEQGQRRALVPVSDSQGRAEIALDPQFRTIWYEVEILAGG